LPRTSTGKVRRKPVAEWLALIRKVATNGPEAAGGAGSFDASADWLLKLIAEITGEAPPGVGGELRLDEDLHLDSLGRSQLAAALEERLGIYREGDLLDEVRTLGELRDLAAGEAPGESPEPFSAGGRQESPEQLSRDGLDQSPEPLLGAGREGHVYPHWPWLAPIRWLRAAFTEWVARPLVWLLANPRILLEEVPASTEPMLIVANHVTEFDGPLIQFALPRAMRRRVAAAMSGEMLQDYRHFRNPEHGPGQRRFMLLGPVVWALLTALFNVFPLPRRRDFQRSFAHAGEALDRGYNVLVFPEGTRSATGELARFRGGIGLLVKQSGASVLPVALTGLAQLKAGRRGWFRTGTVQVRVGKAIRFDPTETEAAITERLHGEVARLIGSGS
jgi:long-chain acyl-CoA synthetase